MSLQIYTPNEYYDCGAMGEFAWEIFYRDHSSCEFGEWRYQVEIVKVVVLAKDDEGPKVLIQTSRFDKWERNKWERVIEQSLKDARLREWNGEAV